MAWTAALIVDLVGIPAYQWWLREQQRKDRHAEVSNLRGYR